MLLREKSEIVLFELLLVAADVWFWCPQSVRGGVVSAVPPSLGGAEKQAVEGCGVP